MRILEFFRLRKRNSSPREPVDGKTAKAYLALLDTFEAKDGHGVGPSIEAQLAVLDFMVLHSVSYAEFHRIHQEVCPNHRRGASFFFLFEAARMVENHRDDLVAKLYKEARKRSKKSIEKWVAQVYDEYLCAMARI